MTKVEMCSNEKNQQGLEDLSSSPRNKFENFIKLINGIDYYLDNREEVHPVFQQLISDKSSQIIKNVYSVFREKTKGVLTGISVLEYCSDLDFEPGDIDFFMNNDDDFIKIFSEVFSNDKYVNLINGISIILLEGKNSASFKHFSELLNYKTKDIYMQYQNNWIGKDLSINGAVSAHTSDYGFLKGDYFIKTGKCELLFFNINIILIKYIKKPIEMSNPEDFRIRAMRRNLEKISPDNQELPFEFLNAIETTFDFKELKIYYDFEANEVRYTKRLLHELGALYLKTFKNISYFLNFEEIPEIELPNKTLTISSLERFFNPDGINSLSISIEKIMSSARNSEKTNQLSLIKEKLFGVNRYNNVNILMALFRLTERIKKYKERGFDIKDPYNILIKLRFLLNMSNLILQSDDDISELISLNIITGQGLESDKKIYLQNANITNEIDPKKVLEKSSLKEIDDKR